MMEIGTDDFGYDENLTKAVGLLEQAVAKDRQFSLAYSALAEANTQRYRAGQDPKHLADAKAALQEAHRLAPEAGPLHPTTPNAPTGGEVQPPRRPEPFPRMRPEPA